MAVDIDVNLNKIDTRDIATIEAQLASIGDGLDLDFDLDDILDGDFDDVEIDLDEKHLKNQIQRSMQKVKADMDSGIFDPFAGGGEGERGVSSTAVRQRAKVISELKGVNRKLAGNNFGQNISITENLPDFTKRTRGLNDVDLDKFDYTNPDFMEVQPRTLPDGLFDNWGMDRMDFLKKMGYMNTPRQFSFDGDLLDDMLGADAGPTPGVPTRVQDLMEQPDSGLETARRRKMMNASLGSDGEVNFKAVDKRREKISRVRNGVKKLDVIGEKLVSTFKRLQPSFRKVYAITATLLPAIAGLAVQIGAVATSFAALGAVGATIGLLGMLGGEADSLKGSMKQAEDRMNSFKQSLFQAVEPVADLFGPIVDRFLGSVVNKVRGLTDELAGLRGFSGIFFAGLDTAGRVLEGLLQSFISLRPVIQGVVSDFGGLLTNGLVKFFRNIIIEGAKSSDTLRKISGFLFQVGRLVYFALKAVVNFVGVLSIFTPILTKVADILENKWIQSLIIIIASLATFVGIVIAASKGLYGLLYILYVLNAAWVANGTIMGAISSLYAGSWIASAVSGITTMIGVVWGLNGALGVTAKLLTAIVGLATLGTGLALAAGAATALQDTLMPDVPDGSSMGASSGGAGTYNDVTMNFNGDMDSVSRHRMVDVAEGVMYEDDLSNGKFGANY